MCASCRAHECVVENIYFDLVARALKDIATPARAPRFIAKGYIWMPLCSVPAAWIGTSSSKRSRADGIANGVLGLE
jgi:hypothetical protein